jgi:hypothetical protein
MSQGSTNVARLGMFFDWVDREQRVRLGRRNVRKDEVVVGGW